MTIKTFLVIYKITKFDESVNRLQVLFTKLNKSAKAVLCRFT